ncbi:MAG TPA: septum formation initiator family protein [Candidatus Acidoferrum sp.]|jgi:cell division protein FtsB
MATERRQVKSDVETEGQVTQFLRKNGGLILGLFVVALIVHDIFGTHGFLAMRRTQNEIERVKKDINRLSVENSQLSDEVKALRSDPKYIEKLAREGMGFSKPGDVIIKIQEWQQQARDSDAKH